MQDDFCVGGRLADGARGNEFLAQRQRVGQVAVVCDSKAAGIDIAKERLDVADQRVAGRGIAVVAYGHAPLEAGNNGSFGEVVANEAHAALGMELAPVIGDDAGGFLAAMLEGVETERCDSSGIRVVEDAEDTAFLA